MKAETVIFQAIFLLAVWWRLIAQIFQCKHVSKCAPISQFSPKHEWSWVKLSNAYLQRDIVSELFEKHFVNKFGVFCLLFEVLFWFQSYDSIFHVHIYLLYITYYIFNFNMYFVLCSVQYTMCTLQTGRWNSNSLQLYFETINASASNRWANLYL